MLFINFIFFRSKISQIPTYYQNYNRKTPAHDVDVFGFSIHHTDDLNMPNDLLKVSNETLNVQNHDTNQTNMLNDHLDKNKEIINNDDVKVEDHCNEFFLSALNSSTPPLSQRSPRFYFFYLVLFIFYSIYETQSFVSQQQYEQSIKIDDNFYKPKIAEQMTMRSRGSILASFFKNE